MLKRVKLKNIYLYRMELNNDINTPQDECIELKNIKYKTMLINGVSINETKSSQSLQNLDKFLEEEKNTSENEPWCKLNKTIKIKKIIDYIEIYKQDKNLNNEEAEKLRTVQDVFSYIESKGKI